MSVKLHNIVQQAAKTFKSLDSLNSYNDINFKTLITLVNELLFVDVSMPTRLFNRKEQMLRADKPLDFLPVYENTNFVIGVFIIKKDAKIPLHDHPGMHGIVKVLHGELEIVSYNRLPPTVYSFAEPLIVTKNETIRLSDKETCITLTPTENNIHEVKCINGPAAFLDILGPPYNDDNSAFPDTERACHYFEEQQENGAIKLKPIPCPDPYWLNQDL